MMRFKKNLFVKVRASIALLIGTFVVISLSSCLLNADQIVVVKTDVANKYNFSSFIKVVSINQTTEGRVKGFMVGDKYIVVSRSVGNETRIYRVSTKDPTNVIETLKTGSNIEPTVEIAPTTNSLIVNDEYINIDRNTTVKMPYALKYFKYPVAPLFPMYSFLDRTTPVNIDVSFYNDIITSSGYENPDATKYTNLKTIYGILFAKNSTWISNLNSIMKQHFSFETQKYIFLSGTLPTDNNFGTLWCYDFYANNLTKLDDNVRTFDFSEAAGKLAYIKRDTKDSVVVCDLNSDSLSKKTIATYTEINNAKFSPKGNWLVCSAGEQNKNDIVLMSWDGYVSQQLTFGYNTTGDFAWSNSGSEIDFTSITGTSSDLRPATYSLKLSMHGEVGLTTPPPGQSDFADRKNLSNSLYDALVGYTFGMQF